METAPYMSMSALLKNYTKDPFTPAQHELLSLTRSLRWVADRVPNEAFKTIGLELLALPTAENAVLLIKTFFIPLFGDVILTVSLSWLACWAGSLGLDASMALLSEKLATENLHQIAYRKIITNCCIFKDHDGIDFCIGLVAQCQEVCDEALNSLNALIVMSNESIVQSVAGTDDQKKVIIGVLNLITGIILQQYLEYGFVIPCLAVTMQVMGSRYSRSLYAHLSQLRITDKILQEFLVNRTTLFQDDSLAPMHVGGLHGIIPDIMRDEMVHLRINSEVFRESFACAQSYGLEGLVLTHIALLINNMPIMSLTNLLIETMPEFDFGPQVDVFIRRSFWHLIGPGPYKDHPEMVSLASQSCELGMKEKIPLGVLVDKYSKIVCAGSAHEAMPPVYSHA